MCLRFEYLMVLPCHAGECPLSVYCIEHLNKKGPLSHCNLSHSVCMCMSVGRYR